MAALAFLPFIVLADTGDAVTAVLRIVGSAVAGGAGAFEGYCRPVLGPAPPEASLSQTVTLFHDPDGDDLLDPGDMVAYTAEVQNLLPEEMEKAELFIIFPATFGPFSFPEEAVIDDLGSLRLMRIPLTPIGPYGKARIGFTARLESETEAPLLFIHGFLRGGDFTVTGDVAATATVLDPVPVVVREVAGLGGSLFPAPGRFVKEVGSGSIAKPGEEIRFYVSFVAASSLEDLTILDILPAPLKLVQGSVYPHDALVKEEAGVTLILARYVGVTPGQRVLLSYSVVAPELFDVPYAASRAMAIFPDGEVIFSDDPRTQEMNDPTAVLFPWTKDGWFPQIWEEALRKGSSLIPVVLRQNGGVEVLRWARFGPRALEEASPSDLVFMGLAEVPLSSLPEGGHFGFLRAELPSTGGKLYVPVDYGLPIFGELSDTVEVVQYIPVPPCGEIYLPILVEVPAEAPRKLTGVVMDEDI